MSLVESALAPVLRALAEQCGAETGFSPTVGLIRLLGHQRRSTPAQGPTEIDAGPALARTRDAPVLATFGYLAAIDGPGHHLAADGWRQARTHLAGREPFPEDRASYFFRPWELYGLALGVSAHRDTDPDGPTWLAKLLEAGVRHMRDASLEHRLAFNLAAQSCECIAVTPVHEVVESLSPSALALMLWARERLGPERFILRGDAPEAILLDRAMREPLVIGDAISAAFVLTALHDTLFELRSCYADWLKAEQHGGHGRGGPGGSTVYHISGEHVQFNNDSVGTQNN